MTQWRYIAQRAVTGEFLDYDVPLARDELSWSLTGAGSLRGTITADTRSLTSADGLPLIEPWSTLLYAEADGEIRWGGIVIDSSFSGDAWTIEAAGFATYPYGTAWVGPDIVGTGLSPYAVVRQIWDALQAHPDGNLGVTVRSWREPSQTLGTAEATVPTAAAGLGASVVKSTLSPDKLGELLQLGWTESGASLLRPTTSENALDYSIDSRLVEADVYQFLGTDVKDCGAEIEDIAAQTHFDYVESHEWDGDSIRHYIDLRYPRAGNVRDDLSFVQDSNIISVVTPQISGDEYANEIIGLGAGEGAYSLRASAALRDGKLRRTAVYTDKSITDQGRLAAVTSAELDRRRRTLEIDGITVRNHPNAPIGAWQVGDDILVEAHLPWLGDVQLWCRVVGWSLLSEDTASLQLVRSDRFTYMES